MNNYRNRIVDLKIKKYLETFGAINVVGPKWCGKTTTSTQFAKTKFYLMDLDTKTKLEQYYNLDRNYIFNNEKPILFDEWQDLPFLWDAARYYCDFNSTLGNFIFTGSTSKFVKTLHSGTGRIAEINLYPMSLYESGDSNGLISLKDLFEGKVEENKIYKSNLDFNDLAFLICRGGWPSIFNIKDKNNQLLVARDYFKQIYKKDIFTIDGKKRNSNLMEKILKSYARNNSTLASKLTLLKDVSNDYSISETTLNDYLRVLEKLFIIQEINSWNLNIRSKESIRKSPKREFVDPSIAMAALSLTPDSLMKDLKTFGFAFENLCIRDLKVYSDNLNGEIKYYRDRFDLEVDAVLSIDNGDYALIEIKLGSFEFDKAAENLLKIESLIKEKQKENKSIKLPKLKIILTAMNEGYRRKDGVWIIPLGVLKN